ncbi:ATP-binding protein [Thalassospira sp. MA62]|nr:ATP-binding protein [Thalassospira sp. MA62]
MKHEKHTKQTLTLIRGLPGSGKSTLANGLCQATGAAHFEADMFMVDKDGFYEFDRSRLSQTHARCEAECLNALSAGKDVVVSNTFTRFREMKPYITMAEQHDIRLQIVECHGQFGNIHMVPKDTLADMRKRWEDLPAKYR